MARHSFVVRHWHLIGINGPKYICFRIPKHQTLLTVMDVALVCTSPHVFSVVCKQGLYE